MRQSFGLLTALGLALVALPAAAAPAPVTTAGELADAFADGAEHITLGADITIDEPLVWTGTGDLEIRGEGHTITAASGFDVGAHDAMLLVANGADVKLEDLDLIGTDVFTMFTPGGFSALRVDVPANATGEVEVDLRGVSVTNVGLHGIYIEDQVFGSDASVKLHLRDVHVVDAGVGGFDEDGVRVNEGGEGDIDFTARDSTFVGAGADGVELDERGPGDVDFKVRDSDFTDNGDYCSVRFSDGEDDDLIEAAFETEAAAQAVRAAYEDPTCVEVEEDDGDIDAKVRDVLLDGNVDEGIKYSEEGDGSVKGEARGITALDDENDIEYEEAGDGDLDGKVRDSVIDDAKLTEEDDGDLSVTLRDLTMDDIEAEQTGDGEGEVKVKDTDYDDADLTGVTLR